MTLTSAPRVVIRSGVDGFVLQNERDTRVSAFLKGKSLGFGQTLLVSLMGLCPVAHREAFVTACHGSISQQASLRLATEAMLESVRVYLVDWKRFVDDVKINQETLEKLGQLRQRLFTGLSSQEKAGWEHLFVDTQRFVRDFQITYARLQESLLEAIEVFGSVVAWDSSICLTPSRFSDKQTQIRLLEELQRNTDFAVAPTLDGTRLLGALARASSEQAKTLTLESLLSSRWRELSIWSADGLDPPTVFEPCVHTMESGWIVASVETVRGSLMHAVKADGQRVEDFHIIAPTEWTFQSDGILLELLNRFVARSNLSGHALERALNLLVALFDACTDVQIVLGDEHA